MTNGVISSLLNSSSILGTSSSDLNTSSLSTLSGVTQTDEEKDFASILQDAIVDSISDTQNLIDSAERAEIEFALGQSDNTHDMMIAQRKASLAVSYTVAVRDRFLEAYKEIMNMQV